MAIIGCGQRITCDVCNGSGCDHCGDVGSVACPCATGSYVHGVADQGESCTDCGDAFAAGADILRSAPVTSGREPYAERSYPLPAMAWHIGCR